MAYSFGVDPSKAQGARMQHKHLAAQRKNPLSISKRYF